MNLAHTMSALCAAITMAACGGGGSDVNPADAARLLLDQSSECFAVAAGRTSPAKFNAAAAEIASLPMAEVCLAWPAGAVVDCPSAYTALSRPYSDGGQCKVVLAS